MPKRERKTCELVVIQLLLLVSDVLAFARFPESVTFDGLGQNYGRCPGVLHCRFVGGMHLDRIVSAESQTRELFVGQVLNHFE